MHAATPSPDLSPLWLRTRAMFARAVSAIGSPAAVAAIARLTRTLRCDIAAWLCPLENIVRKLLLAEAASGAAAYESTGQARAFRPRRAPSDRRETARAAMDSARPETWPARFSMAPPRDPRLVANDRAPRIRPLWDQPPARPSPPRPRPPVDAEGAFRLARRLEALRRVLEDPLAHARRLARLLSRLRRRYPEAAARLATAQTRACAIDREDPRLCVEAAGAAICAVCALRDTS